MCRGCEGWNHEDLYMCRLCRQHANTREGIVHGNMNGVVLCRNNEEARRFVERDKNNGIDTRLGNEGGAEAVRRGACPATRIERHPDYNDDGTRVVTLLDTTFDRAEKILRVLATIVLTFVLVRIMYELEERFLPSLPPDKGTLSSALLPLLGFLVVCKPVRDATATFFHKCLEWTS
jgi:hypothetical protein